VRFIGQEKRKKAKKPWMTQEIFKKTEERRKWKNVNIKIRKKYVQETEQSD